MRLIDQAGVVSTGGVGETGIASSVWAQPDAPTTVKNKQENGRLRTTALYFLWRLFVGRRVVKSEAGSV